MGVLFLFTVLMLIPGVQTMWAVIPSEAVFF